LDHRTTVLDESEPSLSKSYALPERDRESLLLELLFLSAAVVVTG